jgi:hypothetical protein
MEIAKRAKSLEVITPVKGSKDEWDNIHGAIIKAAFQGISACGEEDVEKLEMSIDKIEQLKHKGHGAGFK